MPSATTRPSPSYLFYHLPDYRVLLCKECRYAIQPSAVSRHLKDIHHIYRSDRQALVDYATSLQLSDPRDVVLPPVNSAPIPFLPTQDGLACIAEGCVHLCITMKRMKSHWAKAHNDIYSKDQYRHVTLQTLFRGNQLKYFIVSGHSTPEPPSSNSPKIAINSFGNYKNQTPVDEKEPRCHGSDSTSPSECNINDRTLLDHFINFTYNEMGQGAETRSMWQVYIPDMALRHDFLMHGILACSAFHLAHLQPQYRRHYQALAACHQAHALPKFRLAIGSPSEENCNAILAFSQLLIINCLSSEEQDGLLLVGGMHDSGLPDWLQVVRGSCTIFQALWGYMETKELSPLMRENTPQENIPLPLIPENPVHAAALRKLLDLPFMMERFIPLNQGSTDSDIYRGAFMGLCRAFSAAVDAQEKGVFTMWTAVHIWPAKISLEFLELLRSRKPAALLLLAYYCVLLGPLEERWFAVGIRKRLLERIWGQLDEQWRPWLDFPFKEAGLQFPAAIKSEIIAESRSIVDSSG